MKGPAYIVAMTCLGLGTAGGAVAPASDDPAACMALSSWTPVNITRAQVVLHIPCSDDDLQAFKFEHQRRRHMDGMVGCDKGGRSFRMVFFENTPSDFYANFVGATSASQRKEIRHNGHRAVLIDASQAGGLSYQQLEELSPSNAILMTASSKTIDDLNADNHAFLRIAACFFKSPSTT